MRVFGKYLNIFYLFFFAVSKPVIAADISGIVMDEMGRGLSFATIYVKETGYGTTTNLEGIYEISLEPGEYTLIFQYLGYKTETREISIKNENIQIDAILKEQSYILPDLTYVSGEDPAYSIMRQVIAKSKYHLYQLESYKTNVYVKGTGRVVKVPFLFRKRLEKEGIDSTKVFTVESLTELSYELPNKYTEKVISVNTNIEEEAPSPMPYIKTSFYEPKVADALSPLAPNAFAHYKYRYDGAFNDNGFTIFKIYVQPRIKGDQVFEGHLYIIEDLWAIHSLNFTIFIQGFKALINQIYKPVQPDIWMPVTLKFDVNGSFMGFILEFNYAAVNNDYEVTINRQFVDRSDPISKDPDHIKKIEDKDDKPLDKIKFDQDLSKREMRKQMREYEKQAMKEEQREADVTIVRKTDIDSMAYDKDSSYWAKIRPIPLTPLEVKNYEARDSLMVIRRKQARKDSLRQERNKKFRPEHIIIGNNYKLSERSTMIWHPLWSKISYNTVEGVNIHAKLDYRLDIDSIKSFTIGTNSRYAFSSKRWNGLIFLRYDFKRKLQRGYLQLEGGRYITQINTDNPIPYWWNMLNTLFIRKNYMKLFERDYLDLKLRIPFTSKFVGNFSIDMAEKRSLENSSDFSFFNRRAEFAPNNPENILLEETRFEPYNLITTGINLEYFPFLKYTVYNDKKSIIQNSSPIFKIGYKYGRTLNSQENYHYSYLFGDVKYGLDFGVGNRFDIVAGGGRMFLKGDLDFPEFIHFMGNETILITGDLFTSFRMLPYYYYSTNKYWIKAHTYYQFRKLLITQILYARIAGLREDLYINYLYSNAIKNYYEIGYAMDNIFRFIRLEVIGQFIGSSYEGIGFRIGISKKIAIE
jgi:hypothetical protein